MIENSSSDQPQCPSCGGSLVRYVAKKHKWSCQDPECAELFDETMPKPIKLEGYRIFLSYAHHYPDSDDNTAELVNEIYNYLVDLKLEVWIDTEQLNPGDNWRAYITDGIIKTDRVLSFLSPRSVRDPGVCLDEIGIAMSHKHGAIATVLADERVSESGPATVCHIQYLDMSGWKNNKKLGDSDWKPWIKSKVNDILDIISKNTGFSGDIDKLSKKLSPLCSTAKIGQLIEKGMIGRKWIINKIEEWRLSKIDQRMFWLVADPGMGKSTIAAYLVHYSKIHVVAYHFCQFNISESRDATRFVHNLAFMLAARLQDYQILLKNQLSTLIKDVHEYTADELMNRLLIEPLRNKIDGKQSEDRLLVVVDALDEASAELTQLLARTIPLLPAWLGFIVTSRPEVKAELAQFPAFELSIQSNENRQDMEDYLKEWSSEIPSGLLSKDIQNQLLRSSEYNIQYLVMARDGYKQGKFDLKELSNYPTGLGGIYLAWLQRQMGDKQKNHSVWTKVHPLLGLLCVAPEPLPLKIAEKIMGWESQDRMVALSTLGSLVVLQQDGCLRLCHCSLAEWLSSDQNQTYFGINSSEAIMQLANGLYARSIFNESGGSQTYTQLMLPEILTDLGEEDSEAFIKNKLDSFILNPNSLLENSSFESVINNLNSFSENLSKENNFKFKKSNIKLQQWINKRLHHKFGPNNFRTQRSSSALANLFAGSGREQEALTLRKEIYRVSKESLGLDHPNTIESLVSLACSYSDMGDEIEATKTRKTVLSSYINTLGIENLATLQAMNNLACSLLAMGELEESVGFFRQVLTGYKKAGETDHQIFLTQGYLASALEKFGENVESLEIRKLVLSGLLKETDKYHPDTLSAMNNLAASLSHSGDHQGARELREEVLSTREETLGDDHPDTLRAMSNLADSISDLNDDQLAVKAMREKVLMKLQKALGPEHPDTLDAKYNLAISFARLGDLHKAKNLQQEVLIGYKKKLGVDHFKTLMVMFELAISLAALGEEEEAKQISTVVLEARSRLLGPDHPSTLGAMTNLASSLFELNDKTAAKMLLEQVVAGYKKIYGENHHETQTAISNLDYVHSEITD